MLYGPRVRLSVSFVLYIMLYSIAEPHSPVGTVRGPAIQSAGRQHVSGQANSRRSGSDLGYPLMRMATSTWPFDQSICKSRNIRLGAARWTLRRRSHQRYLTAVSRIGYQCLAHTEFRFGWRRCNFWVSYLTPC